MKNKFLGLSIIYWVVVLLVIYNLKQSSILETNLIWVFFFSVLVLYIILLIGNFVVKSHDKQVLAQVSTRTSSQLFYYESKLQYWVVSIVLFLVLLVVTVFDIGSLADATIYFLSIDIFAIVFLFFYKTSTFELTEESIVWSKGSLKISSPWSEVVAIHYDWEPALVNTPRKFRSTNFILETKNGLTKYADKTNIKLRGSYSLSSRGDELIEEIKKRCGDIKNIERTGAVSMFRQTQKLKDVVFLLLAIFLVPVVIIVIYYLIYGGI